MIFCIWKLRGKIERLIHKTPLKLLNLVLSTWQVYRYEFDGTAFYVGGQYITRSRNYKNVEAGKPNLATDGTHPGNDGDHCISDLSWKELEESC